jgi:hypothetical protein
MRIYILIFLFPLLGCTKNHEHIGVQVFTAEEAVKLKNLDFFGLREDFIFLNVDADMAFDFYSELYKEALIKKVDLHDYEIQAIGFQGLNDERKIFYNAICRAEYESIGSIFTKELIVVFDGGKCFFNGYYSIDRGVVELMTFNSDS